MQTNEAYYLLLREQARALFVQNPRVPCPYFGGDVVLNAERRSRLTEPLPKLLRQ